MKRPRAKPWDREKAARRELSPDERWAAEIAERLLASCHPDQAAAAADPSRFLAWLVGRGGGKTTAQKVRFIIGMARTVKGRFLYGAPTQEMAAELLWDPMKETCERLGIEATFKEVGKVCTFKRTGSRLKLVGLDDKREMGKHRGKPHDGVGLDEICEFPPELIAWFYQRIVGPRLGERKGWMVLSSTPGDVLRGLFYEVTKPGSTRGVPYAQLAQNPGWRSWVSHFWSLKSVSELPRARELYPAIVANYEEQLEMAEREGWGPDHPIRLRELEGRWAVDDTTHVFTYRPDKDGQPWNEWDPPRRGPLGVAVLPTEFTDWMFVIAMDEGGNDPFACNAFAFSPSDASLAIYHVWGFEQGRRRASDKQRDGTHRPEEEQVFAQGIAVMLVGAEFDLEHPGGLIGELGEWPVGMGADAGESLIIELARVYGLQVRKHDRSHKYKFSAIRVVNGDLVLGRLRILKGSALAAQLGELQWDEDKFGNLVENKAMANHCTDTLIVARMIIAELINAGTVTRPEPTPRDQAAEVPAAGRARGRHPGALPPPAPLPPRAKPVLTEDERVGDEDGPAPRGEFAGMLVSGGYDD